MTDHLGNVVATISDKKLHPQDLLENGQQVTDTSLGYQAEVVSRHDNYPFGDSSLRTYSKKRYQFIGREKDAESGLHYWSARYYSAWTCRFISVDPLASKYQFYSPYIYAGNKPINKVDIDGLQEQGAKEGQQGGGTTTVQDGEGPTQIAKRLSETHGIDVEWTDIVDHPDNAKYFENIPKSERHNPNYEGFEGLNMNEGDNISFNIEEPQTFQINEEGIPTEKETGKEDFNFKDDDFWEVEPTYTKDEVNTLARFGTSQGMNKLIGVMIKTIAKTNPALGQFLEVIDINIDLENKEFNFGFLSVPGGEVRELNNMILDIKIKGRLRTIGKGANVEIIQYDLDGNEDGSRFYLFTGDKKEPFKIYESGKYEG